jgi:hypothetical protein
VNTRVRHRYVCDVLRSANQTANWGRARALYEQCRHIRRSRTKRHLPNDLRGALAECLSDLAVSYCGREELFVEHSLAVFAEVNNRETFDNELFAADYRDRAGSKGGLPGSFETVVETSRRYRDARRLALALADAGTSGILCGSVSYGPFYNVRGHHRAKPASDLDLIVVVHDTAQLSAIADCLSGLAGADRGSVDRFRARAEIFTDRCDDGMTVLSHKVRLWADCADSLLAGTGLRGDYQASLHFLTRQTFGYALVESSTALTQAAAGGRRTVRDYRETWICRADLTRTFAGREHAVAPQMDAIDGGWLRSMTAYVFDETDCYCPGFLQTTLLPVPELLWDELGVRPDLATFTRKFYDRYRHEKSRNPDGLLRPSLTHVRRDAFAPYIIRQFDLDV